MNTFVYMCLYVHMYTYLYVYICIYILPAQLFSHCNVNLQRQGFLMWHRLARYAQYI